MLLNVALGQKPKNKDEHLKALAAKMVNSLRALKEKKLQCGAPENDAEIVFIDKLIQEFESDLQRKR